MKERTQICRSRHALRGGRTGASVLVALLAASTLVGCFGDFKAAVRTRAAQDFQCQASEVELSDTKPYAQPTAYLAKGCGHEQGYEGGCDFGGCLVNKVPTPQEQQRGRDAAEARRAESSPASGEAPGAGSGNQSLSVEVYNACPDTVKLFQGHDPKFGSGRSGSLSHNQSQRFTLGPGDELWLLDEKGDGISSLSASPSMSRVEINSSCSGFRPR